MVNFKKKKNWRAAGIGSLVVPTLLDTLQIIGDSMPGFLALKEKGLRSTTLLALRYRDEMNDWNYKLKKVRKPLQELITGLSSASEDSESV